ncbi:hypothetical protein [Haloarchaeobius sp. HRN-SO-5]|uniref:hypothetical protein n=1 Tax=Haloarchaeobius sp. HRN-SO-5 TaxID=3446118 RepID=UPI003EBF2F7B
MAEFSTSTLLEVSVSQRSLADARQEIEDSIGSVDVDVSTSGQAARGARRSANVRGREQAMSRQLLSGQQQELTSIDSRLDENVELNERRNDLLEMLVDATEEGTRARARFGGAGGAVGSSLAVGGVLIGLGSQIGATLGGAFLDTIDDWTWPEIPMPDWWPSGGSDSPSGGGIVDRTPTPNTPPVNVRHPDYFPTGGTAPTGAPTGDGSPTVTVPPWVGAVGAGAGLGALATGGLSLLRGGAGGIASGGGSAAAAGAPLFTGGMFPDDAPSGFDAGGAPVALRWLNSLSTSQSLYTDGSEFGESTPRGVGPYDGTLTPLSGGNPSPGAGRGGGRRFDTGTTVQDNRTFDITARFEGLQDTRETEQAVADELSKMEERLRRKLSDDRYF